MDNMRILEVGDVDEASDMALAIAVGEALNNAYPDHPWVVGFQGRNLVVRHLSIASEVHRVIGRDGFAALLPREKLDTPKGVTQSAIEFGGQMLEAFGLTRGRWDGTIPIVPISWNRGKSGQFH